MIPIWKPYFISLGNYESASYTVAVGDDVIYSGVAYLRPGATSISICINDIVANYLFPKMFTSGKLENAELAQPNLKLSVSVTNGQNGAVTNVEYGYDYSGLTAQPNAKIAPIADVLPYGYPFVLNTVANRTYDVVYYKADGSHEQMSELTTSDKMDTIYTSFVLKSSGYVSVALFDDVTSIEDDAPVHKWKLCADLDETVLLYCNEFGGWEILPLVLCKRTDNYDRKTATFDGLKKDYAVEVGAQYSCITPYISEAGARNMHHFLGSPYVYKMTAGKENSDEIKIVPVRIIDTNCEYKTFINNGCKLIQYSFVVEESETITRR